MRIAKLECDNCHEVADMNDVDGWLRAATQVGNLEAMARRAQEMEDGKDPDYGDFCSLRCLGEWAFAQELLRSLDEGGETE